MAQEFEIPLELESALGFTNSAGNNIKPEEAFEIIRKYIETDKFDVNALDMNIGGYSLLHKSIMAGEPTVVKYLLDRGAKKEVMPHYKMTYQDMLLCVGDQQHATEISNLLGLGNEQPS